MAHTFGKASARASSAANPVTTAAFQVVTGETVLVLMIKTAGATDRAGGAPAFAGRAMTQANTTQKAAVSPECGAELWYLLGPPVGTWTASIPNTNAATLYYTLATGKAKGGGSSALDQAAGSNNTSTNPSAGTVTTTENGAIGFAIVASGATTWAPTAQTGTVIANTDDGADGGGEQYGLQVTKGTFTLNWTFATSDDWGAVCAWFKEVQPHNFENYKGLRADSGICVNEKVR